MQLALQDRAFVPTEDDMERWKKTFFLVDVDAELAKMQLWLKENKRRRPVSAEGVRRFVFRWLSRASDSTHYRGTGPQAPKTAPEVDKELKRSMLYKHFRSQGMTPDQIDAELTRRGY